MAKGQHITPPSQPNPVPAGMKELPPGARGLTPEQAAASQQRHEQKVAEMDRAAAATGTQSEADRRGPALTQETAKKFRCATKDGVSAIVERLGDGKFRVQVEKLHRADAEQPPVEVDVRQFRDVQTKGPDNRLSRPILQDGNGVPRHDAIVAFMIACGIRGSDLGIGCTPLE